MGAVIVAWLLAATLLGVVMPVATPMDATPTAVPEPIWQAIEWTDLDGRTWHAEDLSDRVVLLDFWATWCPPCLAELPHLRQLQDRAEQDDRLVIVGIALDTIDRRRLRSFLRRQQIDWPQVHERRGTRGELARRFGVEAVPATFLIDRDGRLVARDLRGEGLDAAIDALLGPASANAALNRQRPPARRSDRR
ncbi:MAG: TlpA disulfide reductase family protein [Acidobacteriota bacterium]